MTSRRKLVSKDAPPSPMVELRGGHLLPATPYDAERMQDFAQGTMFDLVERRRRSLPQLRLYWRILRNVCRSTDAWPTEKHLHNELKMSLGYAYTGIDLMTKRAIRVADSINFDSMSQDDFNLYFERAMALLSSHLKMDPMDLIDGAGR